MSEQLDLFDGPDGRNEHFHHGASKFPTHAVIPNIGKSRVLGYHGRGYFMLLDPKGERRYMHRDRLTFL